MLVFPRTRLFLIGCPRSGTTLLQSLLAAHPQIASFPETHFFSGVVAGRWWLRKLGIAPRRATPRFHGFLQTIDHLDMRHYLPRFPVFTRQYVRAFVDILDTLMERQGNSLWLEKTPGHLRYIDAIEQYVKGAKFIHIMRNGADVVASIYDVTHRHPESWSGAYDIDRCIRLWVEAVESIYRHRHKPTHMLVVYEKLVENPRLVLRELCEFIGVPFYEGMLRESGEAAKRVILDNEPWKVAVGEGIRRPDSTKFHTLFDKDQRRYILDQLAAVAMGELIG